MAYEIRTIDGIARTLRRDVLFLEFVDPEGRQDDSNPDAQMVASWLAAHGIAHELCFGFSEDVIFFEGGPVCIHLDVAPTSETLTLRILLGKFGPVGGPPATKGLRLSVLTLTDALRNAEQDEPAFWDRLI